MSMEALEKSIKKWRKIVRTREGVDDGVNNCALCEEYYEQRCKGCPVRIKTGMGFCNLSPYDDWVDHMNEDHYIKAMPWRRQRYCRKCGELARKELAFLISLRTIYIAEARKKRSEGRKS